MLSHKGDYTKYLNFTSSKIMQPTQLFLWCFLINLVNIIFFFYEYAAIYKLQQTLALNT